MLDSQFYQCVGSILHSKRPGYGFVNDLVDSLLDLGSETYCKR